MAVVGAGITIRVHSDELEDFRKALAGGQATINKIIKQAVSLGMPKARTKARRYFIQRVGASKNLVNLIDFRIESKGRGGDNAVIGRLAAYGGTRKQRLAVGAQEFGADIEPQNAEVLAVPFSRLKKKYESPWDANRDYDRTYWRMTKTGNLVLFGQDKGEKPKGLYHGVYFAQVAGGAGEGHRFLRDAMEETAEEIGTTLVDKITKAFSREQRKALKNS